MSASAWAMGHISFIRPRPSRTAAAYSRQTFPWTICRSVRTCMRRSVGRTVGLSVCPVHCGKTANRIRMPFGVMSRTGPGMGQVVRFGDRSTGRGTFGANIGCAVVTNGDFTAYVRDSAATRPSSQITLGKLVIRPMKPNTEHTTYTCNHTMYFTKMQK